MSKTTAWAPTKSGMTAAKIKQPKVHITVGADISDWLIHAYIRGLMGDHAPNADCICNAGMHCTDDCASCHQSSSQSPGGSP